MYISDYLVREHPQHKHSLLFSVVYKIRFHVIVNPCGQKEKKNVQMSLDKLFCNSKHSQHYCIQEKFILHSLLLYNLQK